MLSLIAVTNRNMGQIWAEAISFSTHSLQSSRTVIDTNGRADVATEKL